MDELIQGFSTMTNSEAMSKIMTKAQSAFDRNMSTKSDSISVLPPNPKTARSILDPKDIDITDPACRTDILKSITDSVSKLQYPPLEILPCANVQADKYRVCNQPGTMVCSECRLVSYCSKECQKAHWKLHKGDCKNPMRSESWVPAWSREGRRPSFISNMSLGEELRQRKFEEFSVGISLWGNTPAMDVINLTSNEKAETKDFSLAFIASGDLRHVLLTVNSLPSTYSGSLTVLLNDLNLAIVCRNIVLLLVLGSIRPEAVAADIALHFWYSAFMPMEYRPQLSALISKFILKTEEGMVVISLGPHLTISFCLPEKATHFFLHFISSSLEVGDAQGEYDRVRNAPRRRDFRDRMYAKLKPSHRVAFQEYRRFGIVLPFGAMNAHFNRPNPSLFSPDGKWLLTDCADPLEGWNTVAVINAGKAHGAQPENIYGCLYFFLSQQLRNFAHRFGNLKMSFSLFASDARLLPKGIHEDLISGCGIPRSIRFDRIEVSNILDTNYAGIEDVLLTWSPLLTESSSAAIVGYFMNWCAVQEDGLASNASKVIIKKLLERVIENSVSLPTKLSREDTLCLISDDKDALYENSKPFSNFLKKQGLDGILRKEKCRLREQHTIVPHRILAPLQGPATVLPVFPDHESWYYHTRLTSFTWSERFVEFVRL
ncbi:hypothetical protein GALMADRAFT_232756 [Galerina marginata CBS 339.88]|uniref:MYND-type domain-containing protein n=1 Tax=Galerina marginata (strain CBS 339.88) TaxID=685588 RepID=A0A067S5E6_GALM3|nr:hypothetical protein GALMADRAFT_232756 [Galerina marginata CBS 339.88]